MDPSIPLMPGSTETDRNGSRMFPEDFLDRDHPAVPFSHTDDLDRPAGRLMVRHDLDPMISREGAAAPKNTVWEDSSSHDDSGSDSRWQAELSTEPLEARPTVGHHLAHSVRDVFETIIPAIIVALLINLFLAQATRVYGQSMEPNLHSDQRLVVEKLSYNPWLHLRSPQRGDVVVVRVKGNPEPLIKRLIGLPGDRIQISGGQVYVNGVPLTEPYIAQPAFGDFGPVDVPPLNLFVMGDNRNFSNDSRFFGPVPMSQVVGRAWFSYWPPELWGTVQ